jgi:hypothetical protein
MTLGTLGDHLMHFALQDTHAPLGTRAECSGLNMKHSPQYHSLILSPQFSVTIINT